MAATTIPSTYAQGDTPTREQWNAPGKALNGLGLPNDNDGDPILPLSLDLGVPVLLGAVNAQTKVVGGGTSYTVPAGKLYIVRSFSHISGGADTVTPSGGAAINLSTIGASGFGPVRLYLGAGDAIAMAASSYCCGILMDLPSTPSTPARILQIVDNATAYSVPASKQLLLMHATATGTNVNDLLTIDGATAAPLVNPGNVQTATLNVFEPLILAAGQTVAGANPTDILISGLLWSY